MVDKTPLLQHRLRAQKGKVHYYRTSVVYIHAKHAHNHQRLASVEVDSTGL